VARKSLFSGLPDLVASGQVGVSAFVNLGGGTFSHPTYYQQGADAIGCLVGSWTGGASLDVLSFSFSAQDLHLYPGLPDGGLAASTTHLSLQPHSPWVMTAGHFRGDGRLDIAATYNGDSEVAIILDEGGGDFAPPVIYSDGHRGAFGIGTEDFDRDGNIDLVVSYADDNTAGFLKGYGDGGFAPAVHFATGTRPEFLSVGDLNGDSWPDIVVTATNDTALEIFWNQGAQGSWATGSDGGFSASLNFQLGASPQNNIIADLNGDGALDIAATNSGGGTVEVFLNGCP
jgi:hypothetical protein